MKSSYLLGFLELLGGVPHAKLKEPNTKDALNLINLHTKNPFLASCARLHFLLGNPSSTVKNPFLK
ncbi:MAG: hypothetical protein ABIP76_05600 [Verrucomicrobiota bacterium]